MLKQKQIIAALIAACSVVFLAQSSAFAAGPCSQNSVNISSWATGSHTNGPEPLTVDHHNGNTFGPYGDFVIDMYVNPSINNPFYHFTTASGTSGNVFQGTVMYWGGTLRIELPDPAKSKGAKISLVHGNVPDFEWTYLDQNGNVLESGKNESFPSNPAEGEKYTSSFNAYLMGSKAHYLEIKGTGNELGFIQLCTKTIDL